MIENSGIFHPNMAGMVLYRQMTISLLQIGFLVLMCIIIGFIIGSAVFRWLQQRNERVEDLQKLNNFSKQTEEILKESEKQYRQLQESLDRFSKDFFKVMTISDLEQRLTLELKEILNIHDIFFIEVDEKLNLHRRTGGSAAFCEAVLTVYHDRIPIGEIVYVEQGGFVKIGDSSGRIILLGIANLLDSPEFRPQRTWLQTISRYVSILYENLFTIEELAEELEQRYLDKTTPPWILRLLFLVSEKERMKLSADLHDSVLQNQILWYRKLTAIRSDYVLPASVEHDLRNVEQGMVDIIQQIRVTCNELRPPYLKELGLIKALENLLFITRENVEYIIDFHYEGLKHQLSEEDMITFYRITQELLANARKHSHATKLEFSISSIEDTVYFSYQDNGVGMDLKRQSDSFEHIGLSGIRKRVDSIEGELELYSAPGKGVNLLITVQMGEKKQQNSQIFEVFT